MATKDKPRLREQWERGARDWLRFARTPGHDHWYEELNKPAFLSLIPAPRGRALDVGCGEGRLTRELHRLGHRIVGLDASVTLTRAFREVGEQPPIIRADATALPFADSRFDLVIAFMSLFNLDDIPAAIAEVSRVLAPGGRFCFALVHPFASAGRFENGEADAPFTMTDSYMAPSTRVYVDERDGIRMEFHDEHRPLSFYFDILEREGLLVEALREPSPQGEFASRPRIARRLRLPLYLHVRAVKPG